MTTVLFLGFLAAALLSYSVIPAFYKQSVTLAQKREKQIAVKMERLMPRSEIKKKSRYLVLTPLALSTVCFFVAPKEFQFFAIIFGITVGLIVPSVYIRHLISKTKNKFNDQLIDGLMIMSSSFRGGLSLVQALEAVVEEMDDPIRQEFSTVLGENKMGVSLEEALNHLYARMTSPAMQQMITAILLARETGGNLPVIFQRIVNSIRERKKIQQNIDTLTLQGKIQGGVMTLLPIAFGFIVYGSNPKYLDIMMNSDIGRIISIYSVISLVIGGFMIYKISTIKDF